MVMKKEQLLAIEDAHLKHKAGSNVVYPGLLLHLMAQKVYDINLANSLFCADIMLDCL